MSGGVDNPASPTIVWLSVDEKGVMARSRPMSQAIPSPTRTWLLRAALLFACLASCVTARTEVLVIIDTDMDYGPTNTLRSVVLTVRSNGPDDMIRVRQVVPVGPEGAGLVRLPASLGVLPRDGDTAHVVWIEAIGCGSEGCVGFSGTGAPLAVQRAVVGFVPEATVVLRMVLSASCVGVVCMDPGQTCSPQTRRCVDARIDARTLPRLGTEDATPIDTQRVPIAEAGSDAADVTDAVNDLAEADTTTDANTDAGDDAGEDLPRDEGDEDIAEDIAEDTGSVPEDTGMDVHNELPAMDSGIDAPVLDTGPEVSVADMGIDLPRVDTGMDVPRIDAVDAGTDVPPDLTCATGFTLCTSSCVNTMTSPGHCGMCGRACAGGQVCTAGNCACPTGQTTCAGSCRSTASDVAHCGMCGRACATGQSCIAGLCVMLPAGDGCGAPAMLTLANGVATAMGDTTNATHQAGISTCENIAAPDVFYGFTLTRPSLVRASVTGAGLQPTVALRAAACAGADLSCGNGPGETNSTALLPLAVGSYVVIVGDRGTFDRGRFTLTLSATDQAPGDGCYAPIPLTLSGSLATGASATVSGDTTSLTHHPGIASCEDNSASDVFYRVTFPGNTNLRASVTAVGWQPTLAVRSALCVGTDRACGNAAASTNGIATRVPGGESVLIVSGRRATDRGPFTLQVSAIAMPSNDAVYFNGQQIQVSGLRTGNTVRGDTTNCLPDIRNCTGGNDVFYEIDLYGGYNSRGTVVTNGWRPTIGFTGGALDFTVVCTQGTSNEATVAYRGSPSPTRHLLVVGGLSTADFGPYTLTLRSVLTPTGDTCATASDYAGGPTTPVAGDTTDAMPDTTGTCSAAAARDLFFRITVGSSRVVTATVTASAWQPTVALLTGSCTGSQAACGNLAANQNRAMATLGTGTHYVVVGGRTAADFGPFSLLVTSTMP